MDNIFISSITSLVPGGSTLSCDSMAFRFFSSIYKQIEEIVTKEYPEFLNEEANVMLIGMTCASIRKTAYTFEYLVRLFARNYKAYQKIYNQLDELSEDKKSPMIP